MRMMSSMPRVARSMTRDSPPVRRSRWKRSDSRCRCANVRYVELAHRVLADLGEDHVADLRQHHRQDAARAVGDDQHADAEHRARSRRRASPPPAERGQPVGRVLVEDRHRHGDELCQQQHGEGHDDAHAQVGTALRPHERQQAPRAPTGGWCAPRGSPPRGHRWGWPGSRGEDMRPALSGDPTIARKRARQRAPSLSAASPRGMASQPADRAAERRYQGI